MYVRMHEGVRRGAVGWNTSLQAGRSRVSLEFFMT